MEFQWKEIILSGQGVNSQNLGSQGGCRGGQIWAGGQPGPEMVIIQQSLNREMILSGQGVNSQTLGSRGGCRGWQIWVGGQPGPEMVIFQ